MFGALALMPIDKIGECLEIIKARAETLINVDKIKLSDFYEYFQLTWIITDKMNSSVTKALFLCLLFLLL